MKHDPTPQWETITPARAEEILAKNTCNRPIKWNYVRRLADAMRDGLWFANGETIKLNGDVLLDGQHRLLACVDSGAAFRSLVVSGLSKEAFSTIDAGIHRGGSDTLAVLGYKNTSALSAAVQIVDRYFTGNLWTQRATVYTNDEIAELVTKYPGVQDLVARGTLRPKFFSRSRLAALLYLFSMSDEQLAETFVAKVVTGLGVTSDDPAFHLRERLIRNSLGKEKLSHTYLTALFIKAWNAARSGRPCRVLKFTESGPNAEEFPVID